MEKKGGVKTKLVLSISIALVLIAIAAIFLLVPSEKNPIKNIISQISLGGEEEEEEGILAGPNTGGTEQPPSGGGGGGGGGGGSDSGDDSGSDPDCYSRPIGYSLEDYILEESCLAYDGDICIEKTVYCSRNVKNRDESAGGVFEITISFVEEGHDVTNPLDVKSISVTVGPLSSQKIEASTNIQSTGENGAANKNTICFYNVLNAPIGQFCPSA